MEKEQRNRLQKTTQDARKLLEEEFRSQLLQTYDIDVEKVRWAEEPGAHLQAEQRLIRDKLIAWIEHKEAQINDRKEALLLALREMAFTALNRFVALKLMEARELVRPCVSGGLESAGFLEFTAVAQGLLADQESSYRLYLETIFEDVSRELRALFDPRDPASLLWPKRTALLELLEILNRLELAELWIEDETLGWVYQYFNGDAERKKMREESSAPRNSRELAVRNQFFTPRYVVEFLTDNTLGRIWYEMRQGNTGLKGRCRYLVRRPNEIWLQPGEEPPAQPDTDEALSQEELLRQPVYIPHRQLKDPREIRMLDPACGSMHFGLYAFDLYLDIYAEAWEIAKGSDEEAKTGDAFVPFIECIADFATKAAFLREVPRLILLHNVHGVDIDPRATQIAKLTLWLRAQRAWQVQQLEVADRPPITRSNVVCAEPMPGERELLVDFVDQHFPEAERGLVQQLMEAIFDKMQLAGEAGSLLKIEEEIRDAIDQAQKEWSKLAVQQRDLFSAAELSALGQVGSSLSTDLQYLTKDFWIGIEERIYNALSNYAEKAQIGNGLQRRLFAEDAAQGFAFIDVFRKRFDVALMNPPFGDAPRPIFELLQQSYNSAQFDLAPAFVARAMQLLDTGGRYGVISTRIPLFTIVYESWRIEQFTSDSSLRLLIDLGLGVLDGAMVETSAYVSQRDRAEDPRAACTFMPAAMGRDFDDAFNDELHRHIYLLKSFRSIPGFPLSYWLHEDFLRAFETIPAFEPLSGRVAQGLGTTDDFRFCRTRFEVPQCNLTNIDHENTSVPYWVPYVKGERFAPYLDDYSTVVNWKCRGIEVKEFNRMRYGSASRNVKNESSYGAPGIVFPRRTKRFVPRYYPPGMIFSVGGQSIFPRGPALEALGYLSASPIAFLAKAMLGSIEMNPQFEVGVIKRIPFPTSNLPRIIGECSEAAIKSIPPILQFDETTSYSTQPLWGLPCETIERGINCTASKIAHHVDSVKENHARIEAATASVLRLGSIAISRASDGFSLDREEFSELVIKERAVDSLISWFIGVAFGRWDLRCATGENVSPELPDPFAPLPVCPPGQLQNAKCLPARPEDVPAAYPVRIPWDGILVDDPNHPLDLEHRICEVIEIIWGGQEGGSTAEKIEQEACDILGVMSIRDYYRRPAGFFAEHLKRYSKSRRQAPIYWQLSAGNGNYSAWLYYHRFTQDTLYRVLRDFVEPRIQQAEREQFELESQGTLSGDAATRLQEAQTLLQDLRIFKSELDLVAPLWNPNLNDGVIINHAILWRITPYIPWQKKCKECWDKLVRGDYDWAHLAFHLWPERVIPKCTTDRSLAIAHGLEERLWQETNNGNWLPRQLSEADLQTLIAEHSNPAVKSALERFLAAPPPVAPTRTRASRSTRASGSSTPRRARGSAAVVDAEATRQVLLALTAAPSDGLAKTQIADLIGVEANALTAVIKQLKESGQIDQLGERRGARYLLSEQGGQPSRAKRGKTTDGNAGPIEGG